MNDSANVSPERVAALAAEIGAVSSKIIRRLREQMNLDALTTSQVWVILRLSKEGQATTSNLARAEAMKPQSMAKIVAALLNEGLVEGVPDPSDGRQTLLSLTDLGQQWVQELKQAKRDWLSTAIRTRLSVSEQKSLAAAMTLLRRLADD